MDRRVPLPVFGNPPKEYDMSFLDDVVRKLNQLVTAIRNPGEGRQTVLVLTAMPTNDSQLELGGLFQVDGVVRVSLAYRPYVAGVSATSFVGTVRVTT